jgi:hypothetical protein
VRGMCVAAAPLVRCSHNSIQDTRSACMHCMPELCFFCTLQAVHAPVAAVSCFLSQPALCLCQQRVVDTPQLLSTKHSPVSIKNMVP